MSFPDHMSPKIGVKCIIIKDDNFVINKNEKCLLCLKSISAKAFAKIERDSKERFLCSQECFRKYYEVPAFTLEASVKKARRQLKFSFPITENNASASKYQIKDITPKKGKNE